jgi:hypothetical protein
MLTIYQIKENTMEVNPSDRKLIEQVTDAMQAGAAGQETMMSLFTDDAVLVEPFGGAPQAHEGIDAIRARYSEMVTTRPPDFRLMLDRVDTDGTHVIADWTCTSVVLPALWRDKAAILFVMERFSAWRLASRGCRPNRNSNLTNDQWEYKHASFCQGWTVRFVGTLCAINYRTTRSDPGERPLDAASISHRKMDGRRLRKTGRGNNRDHLVLL